MENKKRLGKAPTDRKLRKVTLPPLAPRSNFWKDQEVIDIKDHGGLAIVAAMWSPTNQRNDK